MSDKVPPRIIPMDDDVTSFPADEARLQSFRDASEQLSRFQVPRLVDATNPREKLFYAFFDGTGNDADKDPLHATNVARLCNPGCLEEADCGSGPRRWLSIGGPTARRRFACWA